MKKHAKLSIAVCALLVPGMVMAGAWTWTNGGGDLDWANAANWDGGAIPGLDETHINNGDAVAINAGTAAFSTRLVMDNGVSVSVASTATLDVYGQALWGNAPTSLNNTMHANGTVTVQAELGVGMNGTGVLNVNAGSSVEVQGAWLIAGYHAGGSGIVNVNGGSLNVVNHMYMGLGGHGDTVVNSGTVNIGGNLIMAANPTASATFTVNGGVTTINGMNMGGGAGTSMLFDLNGGEVINVGGWADGANASYQVGDGVLTWAPASATSYDDVHALVSGATWTYDDQMYVYEDANGVHVTSIPEPATMGLMALFGGAMFAARRMFA